MGASREGGLVVISETFTVVHRPLIMSAAARNNVPAVYPLSVFARDSGLLSYVTDQVDLVGMDLVALGQIGHRRLFSIRFQRDLRLQGAVNLASHLRHPLLRLSNGAADFQLSPWSQKRDLFHLLMIARLIEAGKLSICLECVALLGKVRVARVST